MGWFLLTLLLTGLLWKIAPEKIISPDVLMTGAGVSLASSEQAAGFSAGLLLSAQCASCHAEHYKDWSRSFHARSLSSEGFLRTFSQYMESLGTEAREAPQASMACFSCHAPLLKNAEPELVRRVTARVLAKDIEKLDGFEVSCAACHGNGSQTFSGPIRNPQDNLFHLSQYAASYKDTSFCANCHTTSPATIPCSDVYTDWKESRSATQGTTCQICHMTERNGPAAAGGPQREIHSHIFPGGRSAAMLQKAVALRLKGGFRKNRLEVTTTVRNLVPHRVPDG
jgi:hypothetical protein